MQIGLHVIRYKLCNSVRFLINKQVNIHLNTMIQSLYFIAQASVVKCSQPGSFWCADQQQLSLNHKYEPIAGLNVKCDIFSKFRCDLATATHQKDPVHVHVFLTSCSSPLSFVSLLSKIFVRAYFNFLQSFCFESLLQRNIENTGK